VQSPCGVPSDKDIIAYEALAVSVLALQYQIFQDSAIK
jgi:hypothetical protein